MKLSALIILPLAATATALSDAHNWQVCNKYPGMIRAIDKLCENKGRGDTLMVPSPYLHIGQREGSVLAKVQGRCKPPQWLPGGYCGINFRKICATSRWGSMKFGRNGCQTFILRKV